MGFLVYRIKNLNRGKPKSKTSSKRNATDGPHGGPLMKRLTAAVAEDLRDKTTPDINWLKYTPTAAADPVIFQEKWKKTEPIRRQMVEESKTAGQIIMDFPKLLKQPGLVSTCNFVSLQVILITGISRYLDV